MDMAVIVPELCKYGGAEKFIIECVKRWQDKHRITLYATKFNQPMLEQCGLHSFATHLLSPYFTGEHSLLLNSILLPKLWEKEIGRHEIYHTHLWPMHLLNLHPMLWFAHEPLRVINDLKYEQPLLDMSDQGMRRIYTYPKISHDMVGARLMAANQSAITAFDQTGSPDRIIANSRYSARCLSVIYGKQVRDVVYPGINVEDFFYQPPAENMVLCVNQLWQHKRVNLIIEAMQYVEGAHLYIVGEGPEKEGLQYQAAALGVEDRVFFMGSVTDEELAILYARAACVAFAPIREPFGIVALEAMAAGKPLVAADEGGYTEVVAEGAGFLVRPTPSAFAEKINYLLGNKDVAAAMGRIGRETAARFTWNKAAAQVLAVLEEMQAEPRNDRRAGHPSGERTLVGVDYFTWYGKGAGSAHWNDNPAYGTVSDKPLLGYYSSDSGEVIREHLRLLQEAGVDFLAINIHIDESGVKTYELEVAERILQIVDEEKSALRICVQICPYVTSTGVLIAAIKHIRDKLAGWDAYLQWQGQPVAFVFWTGNFDGDSEAVAAIRSCLPDFLLISSSLRLYESTGEAEKTFGLFDGWSLFSPLEVAAEPDRWDLLSRVYQQYDAGSRGVRVFTCSPGYDDRELQDPARLGNRMRIVPRKNGAVFEKMLEMASQLEPRPHFVKISTFNEFHENTHIEPTLEIGSLYLELLKIAGEKLKGRGES